MERKVKRDSNIDILDNRKNAGDCSAMIGKYGGGIPYFYCHFLIILKFALFLLTNRNYRNKLTNIVDEPMFQLSIISSILLRGVIRDG